MSSRRNNDMGRNRELGPSQGNSLDLTRNPDFVKNQRTLAGRNDAMLTYIASAKSRQEGSGFRETLAELQRDRARAQEFVNSLDGANQGGSNEGVQRSRQRGAADGSSRIDQATSSSNVDLRAPVPTMYDRWFGHGQMRPDPLRDASTVLREHPDSSPNWDLSEQFRISSIAASKDVQRLEQKASDNEEKYLPRRPDENV